MVRDEAGAVQGTPVTGAVRVWLVVAGVVAGASAAAAEPRAADPHDDDASTYVPGDAGQPAAATPPSLGQDDALAARLAETEARLAHLEQQRANARPATKLSGYADIGFFAPIGNGGVGVVRDVAHTVFPQYGNYGWVFYGDLLAPQVNSAGEVADLGDLPGVNRFDAIHSRGNPSFIVNEINLTTTAGITSQALFTASVNFTPRQGREFSLGDWFNADLAQIEWLPTDDGHHSIFVGKFESVLGHEYKTRKSDRHFGITPTLLNRYTSGTAIGVKARSKLLDDRLVIAASVTNGSFGTEQFFFHDEIDSNRGKTLSGRVAYRARFGTLEAELAASGQYGQQDAGARGMAYLYGIDLQLTTQAATLRAQWLRGFAPGDLEARAYRLDLTEGAYVEASYLLTYRFGLLVRGELRDATISLPPERLYLTRSWRAVAGLRVVLTQGLVAKLEYLHNGEFGSVPSFLDDVVTSSLVVSY